MKTILVDAINTFVINGQGIDQEIFDLLEAFPNRKIVLTNASKEHLEYEDFSRVPYEIFTLQNNPSKSSPDYYLKMFKYFGLKSQEVIYFEHNPDAIKSSESVGIKTHYFDPEKRDVTSLDRFLRSELLNT